MDDSASGGKELTLRAQRVAAASAYGVLSVTLVSTRLVGLDRSFWHDEVATVVGWIRPGPSEIFAGPVNHQLMVLVAWLVSLATGESEVAFRLLSAVPFVIGAMVVAAWLHVRAGALSGVLFLFLTTASPLLLDITRQARGYGFAFMAMGVMLIAAFEAHRLPRPRFIFAMFVAGVAGTWTLPQFGFAFFAVGLVLVVTDRMLRRPMVVGLAISTVAILAWYAPHLGRVRDAPSIEDGVQIESLWLATAPVDQILLPSLIWIDGTALVAGVVWLPLVIAAALAISSSPYLRTRTGALVLCAGPLATVVILWIAQAFVIPRYSSFLLVPLFMLLATGMATILDRLRTRPAILRTIACATLLGLVTYNFLSVAPDVLRYPREAPRDAARTVESETASTVPVVAYVRNPEGLDYYFARAVTHLDTDAVNAVVCGSQGLVAFVTQPFGVQEVNVTCLDRPGTRHFVHRQYAREEMNVWLVPPG